MIFLKSYIQPAVILVLTILFAYYSLKTALLRTQLAETKSELVIYRDRVEQQNKAIEQLNADSLALESKTKEAQLTADKVRKKAMEDASKIMQANVPSNCEKSMSWLIDQAQKIS